MADMQLTPTYQLLLHIDLCGWLAPPVPTPLALSPWRMQQQEEAQAAERLAQLRAHLAAQEAANAERAVRCAASAASLATLQAQAQLSSCHRSLQLCLSKHCHDVGKGAKLMRM